MKKNILCIVLFVLLCGVIAILLFVDFNTSIKQADNQEQTLKNEKLNSTLWTQSAIEYQMSTIQTYTLASERLTEALQDKDWTASTEQQNDFISLPPAVILDIDETVLDNSPFQARLVKKSIPYNDDIWGEWVNEASADYIKGALEFIKIAKSKGVQVFYVTNRLFKNEKPTFENLKTQGFPVESSDDLLMKDEKENWGSDKSTRRKFIAEKYRILLLIGDDMNDFVFLGNSTPDVRNKAASEYSEYWGKKWLILPNPQYGNWERSTYGYDYKLSEVEMLAKKTELLDTKDDKK